MVKIHLELEGGVDEVARALQRKCAAAPAVGGSRADTRITPEHHSPSKRAGLTEPEPTASSAAEGSLGRWTQEWAAEFTARQLPVARRMMGHVWRAGEAGIHRSDLCRRTELTPEELSSLVMRMGHVRRRFLRGRGVSLPRPVVSNWRLQSYFMDLDFAAVASPDMFGERMAGQL